MATQVITPELRDLLHVDDLSSAFESFISSDREHACYNVGGGLRNAITLYELTQVLGRLINCSPNLLLSDESVREQIHYVTDIRALERDTGWMPQFDIETGLKTLLVNDTVEE